MAHIANVVVKNQWQDLETLISAAKGSTFTFDSSKNYYLVNGSDSVVYFRNQAAAPSTGDDAPNGLPLAKFEQCGLKLDSGHVYASTEVGIANLHIEVEG